MEEKGNELGSLPRGGSVSSRWYVKLNVPYESWKVWQGAGINTFPWPLSVVVHTSCGIRKTKRAEEK